MVYFSKTEMSVKAASGTVASRFSSTNKLTHFSLPFSMVIDHTYQKCQNALKK